MSCLHPALHHPASRSKLKELHCQMEAGTQPGALPATLPRSSGCSAKAQMLQKPLSSSVRSKIFHMKFVRLFPISALCLSRLLNHGKPAGYLRERTGTGPLELAQGARLKLEQGGVQIIALNLCNFSSHTCWTASSDKSFPVPILRRSNSSITKQRFSRLHADSSQNLTSPYLEGPAKK